MGQRHPSGKRNKVFFVRMHIEEYAALVKAAASNGLQVCDFARKKMLEQTIPSLPNANAMAVDGQLLQIRKMIYSLHCYCGSDGPIDWAGQGEAGNRVYDEFLKILAATDAVIAKNKSTWI